MSTPLIILKTYWGYDAFRPMQEDIISSVLSGKDTLALLPTGGGKSLCFQVPALMMDGLCLVVSPLIALMKDQVEQLQKRNIPARSINAGLTYTEIKEILQDAAVGKLKFLYVSPERLDAEVFKNWLHDVDIDLIAVDEAHCISQWGYDFRPAYLKINQVRKLLPDVPVIALTASATELVQDDIIAQLNMQSVNKFRQSFERPNLAYAVIQPESKHHIITEIFKQHQGSSIVYCKSRRQTKAIADLLVMHGISADFYHAGLTTETRTRKQEEWISGKIQTMVCTNAFGMGIDKPDVRLVVHFDIPDCLENYYQEAGRAGRDLQYSKAILLTSSADAAQLRSMIDIRFPSFERIKAVYLSLMNHLQIPAGLGAGSLFPFDLGKFSEMFKLNILESTYAIQALEKDGILCFNESTWQPSTISFAVSTSNLRSLDTGVENLNLLIKGLLRMYEGIIDHDVKVSESAIARFMNTGQENITQALHQLHHMGVIEYKARIDQPSVYLTLNRMYADDFTFNNAAHQQRKKVYSDRLENMIAYMQNFQICRSQQIAVYFGDDSVRACGICDNCLSNKKVDKTPSCTEIAGDILATLQTGPVKVKFLEEKYGAEITRDAIRFLDAEARVNLNEQGELEKF